MKKILITGVSGFVGKYFLDYLESLDDEFFVLGMDISDCNYVMIKNKFFSNKVDLKDFEEVKRQIGIFEPDWILHLASDSSVSYSWKEPVKSFQNNINIYLNILEAVRQLNLKCRILSIGSSEIYGNINKDKLPLKEEYLVDPRSPYAISRVTQELMSKLYVESYKLDIVITRSFNHIGKGQRDDFVIPSFIKKVKEIKDNTIHVGDLNIVRDFTSVEDVVRAYYILLEKGVSGQIYNVCSGRGESLGDILFAIINQIYHYSPHDVNVIQDLSRPSDNEKIVGSNAKISRLGWYPTAHIYEVISKMIE